MEKSDIIFVVARDFSRTPSARIVEEGKFPGTELRDKITPLIKKALKDGVGFVIDLDGAAGYGTSFLEEVFGGLIRNENFSYKELSKVLKIKSDEEPELIEEIWEDIKEASER